MVTFDKSQLTSMCLLLAHLAMPKMSLYDHHLSLVSLVLLLLLLASVSVDSSPINFQDGCL